MSKTNTNLVYKGEVQLSIKKGDKVTKIKKKNAGLPQMFKFFAKALSQHLESDDYPSQISMRRTHDIDEWDYNSKIILKTPVGISGATYKLVGNEWKCVLNAQIGYDDFSVDVTDNTFYYRIYLHNNAGNYDDNNGQLGESAMAYLDINVSNDGTVMPGGLDMLTKGTQLLIEWQLGISNPAEQENGE